VESANGTEALVIVHYVDGYISPNGYPSKAEDGKVVPTWRSTFTGASLCTTTRRVDPQRGPPSHRRSRGSPRHRLS
jgi:Putative FMN-binding domain